MAGPFSPRYAIYYTPAREHPLTVAARAWLGRDAFFGISPAAPVQPGPAGQAHVVRDALTSAPRRYGFHATLKAPFQLRERCSIEELEHALRKLAAARTPCPIGPLKIDLVGSFFALVPVTPIPSLRGLASHIVEELDRFRAPMSEGEFQRRLRTPLDETETTYLVQWGYPYVFDRFRFHMTLTDRVPAESRPDLRRELYEAFAPLLFEDYRVDALSLFVQKDPHADFVVRSQFALRSNTLLKEAV
ncbi:DUF1045 domain-containing protein [Bradyrhizobium sp. CCBAU 53421]|uniref:DUF1045 domain-containing protein n=1 Tax=Bradyrhizobium sp. CCBAU 53421 TaxID=1325120 RepID=UPI00188A607D|nr:DUF1045 domain-containing protein [Bradyrhizobium sp. CCBAU 53421]QOZ33244.1 hypothetical protein XH92_17475 [Bradyrhizobium sp. CCBAU 53421]